VPWLLLLATTRLYPPLRVLGAAAAGAAALGWIGERALGWGNPAAPVIDLMAAHGGYLITGLPALALAAWAIERRSRVAEPRPFPSTFAWRGRQYP
jgi:hypothetical protein